MTDTKNMPRASAAQPVLAMIGLGRMGANLVRRLVRAGFPVCGYDVSADARSSLAADRGATVVGDLAAAVGALRAPRAVWIMLPAGDITEQTIKSVAALLAPGDVIIDGGNTDYHDTLRRAEELRARGLHFVDVGVSGGVWGLESGYGLMFGGATEAVERLLPLFQALAPAKDQGWVHCGAAGSGHFAKMVHNGIEYGLMQAYAEGFALLRAKSDFALDVGAIAEAWRHGTVVRSWLLDLAASELREDAAHGRNRSAGRGFGRRSVDGARGPRSGSAIAGDKRSVERAPGHPGAGRLRRARPGEAPQCLWRPRGEGRPKTLARRRGQGR